MLAKNRCRTAIVSAVCGLYPQTLLPSQYEPTTHGVHTRDVRHRHHADPVGHRQRDRRRHPTDDAEGRHSINDDGYFNKNMCDPPF